MRIFTRLLLAAVLGANLWVSQPSFASDLSKQPATQPAGVQALDLDFSLPVPEAPHDLAYLGLGAADRFTLDQVASDILIIEVFSMYCPICQREAPRVNALYEKIQQVKDPKIRLIGIGAGNTDFEVAFFKENYKIPFPLFSDGTFEIHKKIGEKGTPFFIGLNPKQGRIFFTHSGDMGDLDQFFQKLMDAATTP